MKRTILFLLAVFFAGTSSLAQAPLTDPETRIEWEPKNYQRARPARTRVTVSRAAPAELSPERSGRVSSRKCPYDCASEGLPKTACREWNKGQDCYVEDLRLSVAGRDRGDLARGRYSDPVYDDSGPCGRHSTAEQPSIEISRIRPTRALFDSKQLVRGSVEGECLVEAGLYEDGIKVVDIPVDTTPRYGSFAFSLEARSDRDSEIRVYNAGGQREVFDFADDNYGSPRARFGRWLEELFD